MKNTNRYSPDELDVRLRFFAGVMLVMVFSGSIATVLYNLVWVEQPMSGMAPADKAFFEILKMMTAFLSGVITTLVAKTPSSMMGQRMGGCPPASPFMPTPSFGMPPVMGMTTPAYGMPSYGGMSSYSPPSGPSGGPHLDPDEERYTMALARDMHKDQ